MEAVEPYLFRSFVKRLMESYNVGLRITHILEVVVYTVQSQEQKGIQKGIYIHIFSFLVFLCNKLDIFT